MRGKLCKILNVAVVCGITPADAGKTNTLYYLSILI